MIIISVRFQQIPIGKNVGMIIRFRLYELHKGAK